jgi:S1-C subfamily serine protease
MRNSPLYSSSRHRAAEPAPAASQPPPAPAEAPAGRPAPTRTPASRWERPLLVLFGGIVALLAMILYSGAQQTQRTLTQKDIDAAVLHTLETQNLPSPASKAYEKLRASVVRVRDLTVAEDNSEVESGVGTGVVMLDKGVILTNLHVVLGAKKIGVVFADGLESEATVIGTQPENDLAVLQAKQIPDDLQAATMRSTHDLMPGDRVIAVGFPFGIGPSVSDGVVSGLRREYRSPEGKRLLTNLIQFDAAANPGNSGGPLATMDGEVVGIVTGILNPTSQRVFVGIGFAVPIENAASAIGMSPF